MAWSAPRTFVAAEVLTAAIMNQEVRDNLNAGFPTGSLHYYIRAATTTETLINSFALECNATQVSRTTYSALNTLLSALSYPFGVGNGSSTMHLPDMQGRPLIAMASGGHTTVNALGDSDGLAKTDRDGSPSVDLSGVIATSTGTSGGESGSQTVQSGAGANVPASPHIHNVTLNGTLSGAGTAANSYLVAGVYAVKV